MSNWARQKAEEELLVERELGKPNLKTKLKRFLSGHYNYSRMGKRAAEYREDVKLAKLLKERRETGERERTKQRRKKQ